MHGCPGALPNSSSSSFLGVRDQRFHLPTPPVFSALSRQEVWCQFNKHSYRSFSLLFPWRVGLLTWSPPSLSLRPPWALVLTHGPLLGGQSGQPLCPASAYRCHQESKMVPCGLSPSPYPLTGNGFSPHFCGTLGLSGETWPKVGCLSPST